MTPPLRVATRGSALARRQAELVIAALGVPAEPLIVETLGDRRVDAPIWQIGGQGVFVKEVQAAVLDGRVDLAVHSAKDLPSRPVDGLLIAAVPPRADPRDALVGMSLDQLPPGAKVGTGSVRRRAQLAWLRPDLTFAGLRGNLDTRLAKASAFDAIVVAAAALSRLSRRDVTCHLLDPALMVPQVGQGALAVECRVDDPAVRDLLVGIDDEPSHRALLAERAFLAEVGGDCDLPVGAHATVTAAGPDGTDGPGGGGGLTLTGLVARLDGRIVLRHTLGGDDPEALGRAVARHLLDDAGGDALLHDLVPAE